MRHHMKIRKLMRELSTSQWPDETFIKYDAVAFVNVRLSLNYPTRPGRMGIPMGCPTSLVQLMSIPQGKHTCPGWHMERFPCGVMSDIPVHPVLC